jgi:2-dehydro-3-deoxygluconokinase
MNPDVVIIGEPLVEFSSAEPLTVASTFRLSFSGDALNAAVAAAATASRWSPGRGRTSSATG